MRHMSEGVERIAKERQRQVEKKGWTADHDDEHAEGEMALAAACYATPVRLYVKREHASGFRLDDPFPWDGYDARPYDGNVLKDPTDAQVIRLLEKAGALIAAEIDRLLRQKKAGPKGPIPMSDEKTPMARCPEKWGGSVGSQCKKVDGHTGVHTWQEEGSPMPGEAEPDDLGEDYRALRLALSWIEERTGDASDDMAVSIRAAARGALDNVLAPLAADSSPQVRWTQAEARIIETAFQMRAAGMFDVAPGEVSKTAPLKRVMEEALNQDLKDAAEAAERARVESAGE